VDPRSRQADQDPVRARSRAELSDRRDGAIRHQLVPRLPRRGFRRRHAPSAGRRQRAARSRRRWRRRHASADLRRSRRLRALEIASSSEEPCPLVDTGFEVGPWDEFSDEFGSNSLDGGTDTAEGGSQSGTDSADGGSLEGATGIDNGNDDGCGCRTDRGHALPWLGMFVLVGIVRRKRVR
jgi:hypothetical protein